MVGLHIQGIQWMLSRQNGRVAYTYRNIAVGWESKTQTYQAKDGDGSFILARQTSAQCLEDTTHCILEAYARQLSPSWEAS